ncbi:MAG: LysR family transcriptional regulator [Deltaproteobacteria bacterium]|nr:LysR family transcriptional regulator [Deltaproteobacteria bacterium]
MAAARREKGDQVSDPNARIPSEPGFTLTELRYAIAVGETLHFGRAAAACHVSQPTLSAGLRKLEDILGVQIFERSSKQVRPTQQGELILVRARAVLDEAHRLLDQAVGALDPLAGTLRIGVIPTLAPYLLPWLIPALAKRLPALEPILQEGMTHQILERLREHSLDAIVLARPFEESGLVVHSLFHEPFLLLCPADHAFARRKRVPEHALEGERVLLLTEGHCLRDQALEICRTQRSRGSSPEGDYRATSLETIRQMVIAGLGLTLMPAMALTDEDRRRKSTAIRPFTAPAPGREIVLAHRRGSPRAEGFVRLTQLIRSELPESVDPVPARSTGS